MVEWGVVHTKFQNAKIKIEERMVDNDVKVCVAKSVDSIYRTSIASSQLSDYMGARVNLGCYQGRGHGVHETPWDWSVAGVGDEP
jgi:hypothetical protein